MDGSFPSQQGGAFDSPGGYGGGGGGRGRGRAGFRGTAENSKTKMCTRCGLSTGDDRRPSCSPPAPILWCCVNLVRFAWLDGDCRFGDRCNFAHGEHELRQLPPRGAFGGGGGVGVGRGGGRGGYGERVGEAGVAAGHSDRPSVARFPGPPSCMFDTSSSTGRYARMPLAPHAIGVSFRNHGCLNWP
eukprot:357516-Chlamydomonas_euryale.AAC.16